MNTIHTKKAFTLIELLVVIAIISLLAAVILTSLDRARSLARDAQRNSDVYQIQKALDLYFADNAKYPITGWSCSYNASWNTGILSSALDEYLPVLPNDPVENGVLYYLSGSLSYCYYSSAYGGSGDWYMILYLLENPNEQLDEVDSSTACDGTVFDYGGNDGYRITKGGNCQQ